jgi:hypothetical protein
MSFLPTRRLLRNVLKEMKRMKRFVAGVGAAVLASCGLFGQAAHWLSQDSVARAPGRHKVA